MNKKIRAFSLLALVAVPVLAIARPPLIYHHLTKLAAHPADTVRVVLGQQDVVIHVSPSNSVTVSTDIWADARAADAKAKIIKRLTPTVSAQDGEVIIRTSTHNSWGWNFHFGSSPQARVTITMPASMAVEYRLGSGDFQFINPGAPNLIKGDSGSGNVVIKSASARVVAKTGSGDFIIALDPATQRVKLSSGSGDIRINTASAKQVRISTGSGDINFSGTTDSLNLSSGSGAIWISTASAKQVRISTGSGDITAHWHKLVAASLHASSGSGDLVMFFPADSKLKGTLSTSSGDVDTDFTATIHSNQHSYTLTGGGVDAVQLNASTGSGDITLHKGA